MTIDRKALEEVIAWSRQELGLVAARPIHNDEAIRRTQLLTAAAEAHLATLPRTKTVEVWHVEFYIAPAAELCVTVWADKAIAEKRALALRGGSATCIRVTGPHLQEVPE